MVESRFQSVVMIGEKKKFDSVLEGDGEVKIVKSTLEVHDTKEGSNGRRIYTDDSLRRRYSLRSKVSEIRNGLVSFRNFFIADEEGGEGWWSRHCGSVEL